MSKRLFLYAVLLLISISVSAQTAIKGKVFDASMNGEPMIGVSVQVPGTSVGVVTNLDGEFAFTLPHGKTIVQFSMVGYKTQVVNVKGKSYVEVTLKEDTEIMDEVVVIVP